MNTLTTSATANSNVDLFKDLAIQAISDQYSFEKKSIENDPSMTTKERISARRESMFFYLTLTFGAAITYKLITQY